MYVKFLALGADRKITPITDPNISANLSYGALDRTQLLSVIDAKILESSKGNDVLVCKASFKDSYDRLKRGPACIIEKDVGAIISLVGLTKESVVFEAGSGMGALGTQLAALCKKVYSYDIEKKHLKIAQENAQRLDLENIEFSLGDVCADDISLPSQKVDVVVLDLPNPHKALKTVRKILKTGGFVVFYTPHITQAHEVYKFLSEDFKYLTTLELLQRRWEVGENKLRPKHSMLGHTAFLTLARLFPQRLEDE